MISKRIKVLSVASFLLASFQYGAAQSVTNLRIGQGEAETVVKDSLRGETYRDYRFRVPRHSQVTIRLHGSNNQNYFNVMPDREKVALFNSSVSGNKFVGKFDRDGSYTVRVYLMRAAARRNESSDYSLFIKCDADRNSSQEYRPTQPYGTEKTVNFSSGSSRSTVRDSIRGRQYIDYKFHVDRGMRLSVSIDGSSTKNSFDVTPPNQNTPIFVGSRQGKSYRWTADRSGAYTVRVYISGREADRYESSDFSITFWKESSRNDWDRPSFPQRDDRHISFSGPIGTRTINASLVNQNETEYTVDLANNSNLSVAVYATNSQVYFDVIPSYSRNPIFVGQREGSKFERKIGKGGTYRIRVYQMPGSNRVSEMTNFRLHVSIKP